MKTRRSLTNTILLYYEDYGFTREKVEAIIDGGLALGLNYYAIYLVFKYITSITIGTEFYYSLNELANAWGVPLEDVEEAYEDYKKSLCDGSEC